MEKNWLNLIKLVKMILVSTDGVSINEQAEILSELVCEKFNEIRLSKTRSIILLFKKSCYINQKGKSKSNNT